jgi:hypothetical protein
MEKARRLGQMALNSKAVMSLTIRVGRENFFGLMEISTLASFVKIRGKEKAS